MIPMSHPVAILLAILPINCTELLATLLAEFIAYFNGGYYCSRDGTFVWEYVCDTVGPHRHEHMEEYGMGQQTSDTLV